ncbi:pyrroline-5-carboxylate reductase [Clostridia bacterium]|nr:pyrroline-5-carboxylate reductase [Clostridia bacterium]
MNQTIGFIGGGNMASAIIGGILASKQATPPQIIVSDKSELQLAHLQERYGIQTTTNNFQTTAQADILFLAVKPNIAQIVLTEIGDSLKPEALLISIVTGLSISAMERILSRPVKLVRAMPNTPVLVGEGMSALCLNENVQKAEEILALSLFACFGKAQLVPESLMPTVTGVSGSSPAYAYLFIEAMADAAVLDGMARNLAYEFAAQSLLGAAKMVLDTKKHPGELKDMVCSPGGTTIEAVAVLEQEGLRSAVIKAQRACCRKARELAE